jgi:hypothetical protein
MADARIDSGALAALQAYRSSGLPTDVPASFESLKKLVAENPRASAVVAKIATATDFNAFISAVDRYGSAFGVRSARSLPLTAVDIAKLGNPTTRLHPTAFAQPALAKEYSECFERLVLGRSKEAYEAGVQRAQQLADKNEFEVQLTVDVPISAVDLARAMGAKGSLLGAEAFARKELGERWPGLQGRLESLYGVMVGVNYREDSSGLPMRVAPETVAAAANSDPNEAIALIDRLYDEPMLAVRMAVTAKPKAPKPTGTVQLEPGRMRDHHDELVTLVKDRVRAEMSKPAQGAGMRRIPVTVTLGDLANRLSGRYEAFDAAWFTNHPGFKAATDALSDWFQTEKPGSRVLVDANPIFWLNPETNQSSLAAKRAEAEKIRDKSILTLTFVFPER